MQTKVILPKTLDPTRAIVDGKLMMVSTPRKALVDLAYEDPDVMDRFKSKIDDSAGPDECWMWTGSVHKDGYGGLWTAQGMIRAHRLMYRAVAGQIPTIAWGFGARLTKSADVVVGHICHDRDLSCMGGPADLHRLCVNPRHLELQTRGENVLRGRRWASKLLELAA